MSSTSQHLSNGKPRSSESRKTDMRFRRLFKSSQKKGHCWAPNAYGICSTAWYAFSVARIRVSARK